SITLLIFLLSFLFRFSLTTGGLCEIISGVLGVDGVPGCESSSKYGVSTLSGVLQTGRLLMGSMVTSLDKWVNFGITSSGSSIIRSGELSRDSCLRSCLSFTSFFSFLTLEIFLKMLTFFLSGSVNNLSTLSNSLENI